MKEKEAATPNVKLREERKRRRWSQLYVAERIGTNQFTISRWEQGLTFPGPQKRQELAKLFDMDIASLGLLPGDADEIASAVSAVADPEVPAIFVGARGLIGRDTLVQSLRQRLLNGEHVAISALNGLPGVGKTTLAITLAHDDAVTSHFRHGILWAGLGPTPNILALLSRWGNLLGLKTNTASIEEWMNALREALRTRSLLLVIDDAWSSEDANAFKVGGPRCSYLLTTRFPRIAQQFAEANAVEVRELSLADGITLLLQLAPALAAIEPETVSTLVQSVGGLPLALTLVGKYVQVHSYSGQQRRLRAAIERLRSAEERLRLSQPLPLITSTASLARDASLSLQAVIDVSTEALDEATRTMLYTLSLFPAKPGNFSEDAALAVTQGTPAMLETLRQAGLLEQVSAIPDSGGQTAKLARHTTRYTLHQTIADYAHLHYSRKGNAEAEQRMVSYFVDYTETHTADFSALELEMGCIQIALQLASAASMAPFFVRGVNAFEPFLHTRGLYELADGYLQLAQEAAQTSADNAGLIKVLLKRGKFAERQGNAAQVAAYYQDALTLAQNTGDAKLTSQVLTHLGGAATRRGAFADGADFLQSGLQLARETGNDELIGTILQNLGAAAYYQGDYQKAEQYWLDGLQAVRRIHHDERSASLLENLGAVVANRGDYAQSEHYFLEALALAQQIGHKEHTASLYSNLCEIGLRRKDFASVLRYGQQGLELAQQIGHYEIISLAQLNLGEAETGLGNYLQAEIHLEYGLEYARQVGHSWLLCSALLAWGRLYLASASNNEDERQQRLELAQSSFQECQELAQASNNPESEASAYFGLAQTTAALGDNEAARRLGQHSLHIFTRITHEKVAEVQQWLDNHMS